MDQLTALQTRIKTHSFVLRESEALTRYALIDPLLRFLDWDTADPSQVSPEYSTANGRADYALLKDDGEPVVLIEAKKLGQSLESATAQGIQYTLQNGVLYFAVTDGQRWNVYETHKPVPLSDKRILSFDIERSVAEAARNALAIWRPAVLEGSLRPVPVLNEGRVSSYLPVSPSPSPLPKLDGFMSLPDVIAQLKKEGSSGYRVRRVCLPDNTASEIEYWWQILREAVGWLAQHGHLETRMCPIERSDARSCVVNTKPFHPSGKALTSPERIGAFYFSRHGSAVAMLSDTVFVMRSVGMDPARVRIEISLRK